MKLKDQDLAVLWQAQEMMHGGYGWEGGCPVCGEDWIPFFGPTGKLEGRDLGHARGCPVWQHRAAIDEYERRVMMRRRRADS